ncbi:MAG: NADPH-dependent F420 reductase [Candidatus Planktophila sp.]|nr:NADPH-dependent F420 reductase [Candidatus Planktophila sp.]
MTSISIIGNGNMGQAIAGLASKAGAQVQLLGETDSHVPATGEILVLAVPYPAIQKVLKERASQFEGKIVVDITNPVNFETFDSLTVPADSSAAAEIAAQLPKAKVLKAFNTTFAGTLASGLIGSLMTTVLIAGDDGEAKAKLANLLAGAGLKTLDVGGLKRARELEALGFLQITLAATEKISWTGGFGVVNS